MSDLSHRMSPEELHWAVTVQHDARLEAIDHPAPLIPGERVAWAECDYGNTDHFSFRHRIRDEFSTHCGQTIPAAVKRCPDDLARVLKPCRACVEAMRVAA